MYKIHRLIPIIALLFVLLIGWQFLYRRSQEPKIVLTKEEQQELVDGRVAKQKLDVILPIVGLTLLAVGIGAFVIHRQKAA